MKNRERIARKCAMDLSPNYRLINFGNGIPYDIPQYIDKELKICILNEPGVIAYGACPPAERGSPGFYDMRDAMNRPCASNPGGSFFDSSFSFSIIRGKHIDVSFLGGYQVDEQGNLANYAVPGKPVNGIGGAMDLCAGAKCVFVTIETTTKEGEARIVKECDYPITGRNCVDRIYTETGVFSVSKDEGLTLLEIFPDYDIEQIRQLIPVGFHVAQDLKTIDLGISLCD